MPIVALLFLIGLLTTIASGAAAAAQCEITPSTLQFGAVDTLATGSTSSAGAEIAINCTDIAQAQVSMCLFARSQTGDEGNSRTLISSSEGRLAYSVSTGNNQSWPNDQAIAVHLEATTGGAASGTVSVTGRIEAGQSDAPTGTYTGSILVSGQYQEGSASCSAMTGMLEERALNVAARVEPNCNVEAEDINFGEVTSLNNVPDVQGGLRIACTPGAGYSLMLSGGNNWQNGQRYMRGTQSAGLVAYDLLTDGAAWGLEPRPYDASNEIVPIIGHAPSQAEQPVDNYQDTVIATVFYNAP